MSLSTFKEAVESLAAGDDDAATREHVRGCAECRAHYDRLVETARVLAGTRDALPAEHAAMFARLNAALDAKKPAPVAAPSRRWWMFGLVAAVAAALAVFVAMPRDPEREITLRGGGGPGDVAPSLSFSVYAKAKSGGPVRLVAQFPQSGEARATEGDWLQVKAPSGVSVVAVKETQVVVFEGTGSQTLNKGTWKLFAANGSVDDARKLPAVGMLVVDP
ncbi:MAG: hypothetical protein QM817_39235 [Archangium sp.]